MKRNFTRITALTVCLSLSLFSFAGCASGQGSATVEPSSSAAPPAQSSAQTDNEATGTEPSGTEAGGTILLLSNLSSGPQYEVMNELATNMLGELGYDLEIVYGDPYNDPAGNLQAVQNAMNSNVVGIITTQDGGIKDIMDAYPELYVAGYNTDMISVFNEGGANAAVKDNDMFLGTIVDGYYDGELTSQDYVDVVIEKGYKRVSVLTFPAYAYPMLAVAAQSFVSKIEAYNGTVPAEDQIEIVGDIKTLEFQPLEETYFLEEGKSDLDAIIGFCAGVLFVYPTMKSAMANGLCSPDTKLLTGGFDTDPAIIADFGDDGVMQSIICSPAENITWPIVMLDNALTGNRYSDFTGPERVNSLAYIIDSKEDIDNVMSKSIVGTYDFADSTVTLDDLKNLCLRFNPNATYAGLDEFVHADARGVDALKNR
jgi:ABC-type sugar transport system substrate-binding protein